MRKAILFSLLLVPAVRGGLARAQDDEDEAAGEPAAQSEAPTAVHEAPPLPGLERLAPDIPNVWLQMEPVEGGEPTIRAVVLEAVVVLREGPLELLLCRTRTKEHESVLAVDTQARLLHMMLILAGGEPGSPVRFAPDFRPATGSEINVWLDWIDEQGEHQRVRGQEWVRDRRTGEPLDLPWVFAGSGFYVDPAGRRHYMAEEGDLICVSNFPSAMLDVPVESTSMDAALEFEAYTERIPPQGTRVWVTLEPVVEQ